jgi:hypothetical protein
VLAFVVPMLVIGAVAINEGLAAGHSLQGAFEADELDPEELKALANQRFDKFVNERLPTMRSAIVA